MHFDDRLATVLQMRTPGPALARVQYRQLLDLLGTQPAEARSEMLDQAYARFESLVREMPLADRVVALRDRATRLRSPRLVAQLTQSDPAVADAAIDAAQLTAAQWADLLPALPPAARQRLAGRADLDPAVVERLARSGLVRPVLPPASAPPQPANDVVDLPLDAALPDIEPASIGALVKRIEAYRKAREPGEIHAGNEAPRLPLDEEHVLHVPAEARMFDFATDPTGRIVWADPGVAPMLLGRTIAGAGDSGRIGKALRRRQPIMGERVELGGARAIAGSWRVDATARFDPLTGRFLGHQGRMRRWPTPPGSTAARSPDSEADRIRQSLHELRTPVNAIQGFAEVIQQQLFGPTPHEYRALAAAIAGDAARMLAAFEELERLAKLESAAMTLDQGETDLAEVVTAIVEQLALHWGQRGSGFVYGPPPAPCPVPLARIEVERMVWRLLATLAGTMAPGEQLPLALAAGDGGWELIAQLPASLAGRSDKDLFEAEPGAIPQVIAAGVFGVGFALRLVRAETRAAGGELHRDGGTLLVKLPGLTATAVSHSQAS